ncbi:MAG: hypothetical protein ACXU8A_09190 [Burkholderiaceae bacterium]
MTNRSMQLPLSELTPGMVLSDDLRDSWGNILLPQGTKLTEVTLESLKRYEISTLPILSEELSEAEETAKLEHQQQRIGILFRKSAEDKATHSLMQFMHKFRQGEQ